MGFFRPTDTDSGTNARGRHQGRKLSISGHPSCLSQPESPRAERPLHASGVSCLCGEHVADVAVRLLRKVGAPSSGDTCRALLDSINVVSVRRPQNVPDRNPGIGPRWSSVKAFAYPSMVMWFVCLGFRRPSNIGSSKMARPVMPLRATPSHHATVPANGHKCGSRKYRT